MIGTFEMVVLLAAIRLGSVAYGVSIAEEIEVRTGKRHSLSAIYTTLDRLTKKGFLKSRYGESTAERGGKRKLFFEVTPPGQATLDEMLFTIRKLAPNRRELGWLT
jgi:DNA-binding PadR family transcriptional regulator